MKIVYIYSYAQNKKLKDLQYFSFCGCTVCVTDTFVSVIHHPSLSLSLTGDWHLEIGLCRHLLIGLLSHTIYLNRFILVDQRHLFVRVSLASVQSVFCTFAPPI